MDSFEFNKLIGALLATVFVMFSVSLVADSIFSVHAPEQQGYAIEAAEVEAGPAAAEEEVVPIAALLQDADPAAGEAAFRKCQACHTVEEGGANRIGPNLWDIVNRPVASHEGFSYSAGMRSFAEEAGEWTFDHLSKFLLAPRAYVPGTAMAFAGIRDRQEEANLIAYLRTLSNDPAPLPEAPAAEPAAEEDGAAADPATETEGTESETAPATETEAAPAT